jgi:predicted GIY-YIG superfamily endonuclease
MGAIRSEKRYKNWRRAWKWELIKRGNPLLRDLFVGL